VTTIWEDVNTALTPLALPMAADILVTATGAELPDEFMVYSLIIAVPQQHTDNVEKNRLHHVQVSYYNRAGLTGMPDIPAAMVADGFTRGPTNDLPYNQLTRHFGHSLEFYFLEEE
jgi:hypothetical protein